MTFIAAAHARRRSRGRAWKGGRARIVAATIGLLAMLAVPGIAAAHPLGNFTINHYAGLRVEPDRIVLDVVIDQAEIPAFQARLAFDLDGDGELSGEETEAGRLAACEALANSLDLRVSGEPLGLVLSEAGLSFPPGAGGLSTMRSVCAFVAQLAAPLTPGTEISFSDASHAERLGWREIVVEGSGVRVEAAGNAAIRTTSVSKRLTAYPEDQLAQALNDAGVAVLVRAEGPTLPALDTTDADPVDGGAPTVTNSTASAPEPGPTAAPRDAMDPVSAAVPGGISAGDLPAIFRAADLTPLVLLVSVLTAAALGAWHALTPGHGKTLMAAYLVGTRGTPVHAAGLGLSVALSHTLGILALAALVVGAQGVLPPDVVVRTAPVVAAVSIVVIGGWMLLGEVRRRRALGGAASHEHGLDHDHPHEHEHEHGDDHVHDHPHVHDQRQEHVHGGVRHSHLPARGSSISWRSLFVLGLAGGLIPSASALLILLGSIAAGRPAFGFVLVVAFGLGMAAVMSGIGLALVVARGRLDRLDAGTWLGRGASQLPLVAACLVLGFGLYLTIQAVAGSTTL